MYRCYNCGLVFEEPKKYFKDNYFLGCPECSGSYSKVQECDGCGEWVFPEYLVSTEDGSFCELCIEEYEEVNIDELD